MFSKRYFLKVVKSRDRVVKDSVEETVWLLNMMWNNWENAVFHNIFFFILYISNFVELSHIVCKYYMYQFTQVYNFVIW